MLKFVEYFCSLKIIEEKYKKNIRKG